jgi:hypothetical protein
VLRARVVGAVAAVAVSAVAVAGCGAGTGGASRAAGQFERALRAGDPDAACALLAPDTRQEVEESNQSGPSGCSEAITDEDLPDGGPVRTVEVYGHQARAVLADDTLFLSLFPGGWRVVAAGCEPRAGHPYDCTVKGG